MNTLTVYLGPRFSILIICFDLAVKAFWMVNSNMLCGGRNQKSGCHGDSGGPYVCQKQNGRFTVEGAVSWAHPKCKTSYTVFARVSHYMDWIESIMYTKRIKETEM